jgi:hypothetical protein
MSLIEKELIEYFDNENSEINLIDHTKNVLLSLHGFTFFTYRLDDTILESHLSFYKTQNKFKICNYNILETLIKYNLHIQITYLDISIYNDTEIDLKLLINFTNLTFLYIFVYPENSISLDNITQYLPNSLEILIIVDYWFNYSLFNQSKKGLEYNHYGNPKLKLLCIKSNTFNQAIDNLPETLETLIIQSNKFNQTINYLPPFLKSLVFICQNFRNTIQNLPYSLEFLATIHLNVDNIFKDDGNIELCSNLPLSLQTIISEDVLDENILCTILPNCTFVNLSFNYFSETIIQRLYNIHIHNKNKTVDKNILKYYVDNLYYI